ncbi:MAG: sensor protein KdpD [Chitinophagaceae bacterium]|nr:sensor protein KdpD [Chitinophagaceae bacterium]
MPHQGDEWLSKIDRDLRQQGRLKVYVGMSAGVGKTYRMLQEAHALLRKGIDVQIGLVETHNRPETAALLQGLPMVNRREVFYKGKRLYEMDLQALLLLSPTVVIVDELAHSNIPGSKNQKRWQDVLDLLEAGIHVITAVNIQHIESINQEVQRITGIAVQERVPDKILQLADEVVNIDLTAEELIGRLQDGKIYTADKVEQALQHFFKADKLLQLRELALKAVAGQVERKVDTEVTRDQRLQPAKFLACISSNADNARQIIRKTGRLASYYNSSWLVLYVQRRQEAADRIGLAAQRHLINNMKLATEMGAEVLQVKEQDVTGAIIRLALEHQVTSIAIGRPKLNWWQVVSKSGTFARLLKQLQLHHIDLIIVSPSGKTAPGSQPS